MEDTVAMLNVPGKCPVCECLRGSLMEVIETASFSLVI